MSSQIYRYPLDLTGTKPTNLVVGEMHLLLGYAGTTYRPFVLTHGGFYSDSFVLYDKDRNPLSRDVDYVLVYRYDHIKERTGLDCFGGVVVINPELNQRVYVKAQMVGYNVAYNPEAVTDIVDWLVANPSEVPDEDSIIGTPVEYDPEELEQGRWENDGFQAMTQAIEDLTTVVYAGDQNAAATFRANIDALAQGVFGGITSVDLAHLVDKLDPHELTKLQVALGNLQNYDQADGTTGRSKTLNNLYMTALSSAAAIDEHAVIPLQAHIDDTDNPHSPSAADIDTYTETQINNALIPKLPIQDTAVNALGMTDSSDTVFNLLNQWNRISRIPMIDNTYYGPGASSFQGTLAAGFFGEVEIGGALSYRSDVPGRRTISLQPGIYSYLIVGGGGGGAGNTGTVPTTAGGGGSGKAAKGRLTVALGDVIEVEVPAGAPRNTSSNNSYQYGGTARIFKNGAAVAEIEGGQSAWYVSTSNHTRGGSGGSGAGSGGGWYSTNGGATQLWATPGVGGANGTNGGASSAAGTIPAAPGGTGMGSGYYDTVLQSIDPFILHGFVLGQHGLGAPRRGGGVFSNTSPDRGSCGGGGGGIGKLAGRIQSGTRVGAEGWGAGGTMGTTSAESAGVNGLVSIVNISTSTVTSITQLDGQALSNELGLTAGEPTGGVYGMLESGDNHYLKFVRNGKVIFTPKQPIRHNLTYGNLSSANLVGGSRSISNLDAMDQVRVRLWGGANASPANWTNQQDNINPSQSVGSEWNDLFYPITAGMGGTRWAEYSASDLGFSTGVGSLNICSELVAAGNTSRVARGPVDPSYFTSITTTQTNVASDIPAEESTLGYRPILEYTIAEFSFTNPVTGTVITTTNWQEALDIARPYSDNAIPSEKEHWSFDVAENQLVYGEQSDSFVGLISTEARSNYVVEVELSVGSAALEDAGGIGMVIGYGTDGSGNSHQLVAMRYPKGDAPLVIAVDPELDGLAVNVYDGLVWADGSVATVPNPTVVGGWSDMGAVRLKVTRSGNSITVESTNPGETTYTSSTLINLNSNAAYAPFRGEANYGYTCWNQLDARWKILQSPSAQLDYTQVMSNLRTALPASAFTSGRFPVARLGLGTPSANTALRGDGTWTDLATLLAEYNATTYNELIFIDMQTDETTALQYISTTFSNINNYPVDTIVIFRCPMPAAMGVGNGAMTIRPVLTRAAVRLTTGWSLL